MTSPPYKLLVLLCFTAERVVLSAFGLAHPLNTMFNTTSRNFRENLLYNSNFFASVFKNTEKVSKKVFLNRKEKRKEKNSF